MTDSTDSDDICARLDRIKRLCDKLEAAQGDTRKYNALIERIRGEADQFRQALATHDPKS